MPHGYCTECRAQVTVRNGLCLLDHRVDPSTIADTPGRRLKPEAQRFRLPRLHPRPKPRTESVSEGAEEILRREAVERVRVPATVGAPAAPVEEPATPPPPVTPPPAGVHSITGSLVEELWNLSPDEDIEDWSPAGVDATLVAPGIRMPIRVAIGVFIIAALAFTWRALPFSGPSTSEVVASVGDATDTLQQALAGIRPAIEDLGDGTLDDQLGASAQLRAVDDAARVLFAAAGDLPDRPDATPVRDAAVADATAALDFETELSGALAYGAAVDLVARPIDLPTETDLQGLDTVTATVAAWVNDFQSGVQALPANDLTDTHRAALVNLSNSMPDWQAAYLDSLRARDPEAAATHISELDTQIRYVRQSWQDTAGAIATWAGHRLDQLLGAG